MIYKDKNGTIAEVGDKITGIYEVGVLEGEIILDEDGTLSVKDCDGDILYIDQVLEHGCLIVKNKK
jgi:hypothetical protein